jgi:hypothetical protein
VSTDSGGPRRDGFRKSADVSHSRLAAYVLVTKSGVTSACSISAKSIIHIHRDDRFICTRFRKETPLSSLGSLPQTERASLSQHAEPGGMKPGRSLVIMG